MDSSSSWYQDTQFDHDIYVMIIREPSSPSLDPHQSGSSYSYVGRLTGHGQHPCFSVHFACPPYGNDYASTEAALQAGLAHGRALIEHWRTRGRKPPARTAEVALSSYSN
ncbi:hypothetical protein D3X12_18295 [Pseudomonas protegens]|jgi:hypothetical protein|uniref:Uncharacterized protein n=4 Tax=Pseudomonas TaxID=286 RepID=Q4KDC2_PSEF5|nr:MULTISPECIES: hypothetical protein [Pseudomonas]BCQ61644.1 hypothetical protein PBOI14_33940 [Pseudomonas sp. Boi14]GED74120.1 hypothetical protein PFL02_09700 [Pseudomonas fluorescens]AAY91927.1 conserved hypothetical protein [Pseudomonas protegens Pf-5]AGL84492.1 hypothetical protein PFLCHA0_c27210 [Pseudomonas protegens CHA0]APC21121.1 hypothetical protein BME99_13860 [Pseudomonas protegens]